MPIPKPRGGESKNEYISRCMGDDTMNSEYKDERQRAAVCYTTYEETKLNEIKQIISDKK